MDNDIKKIDIDEGVSDSVTNFFGTVHLTKYTNINIKDGKKKRVLRFIFNKKYANSIPEILYLTNAKREFYIANAKNEFYIAKHQKPEYLEVLTITNKEIDI